MHFYTLLYFYNVLAALILHCFYISAATLNCQRTAIQQNRRNLCQFHVYVRLFISVLLIQKTKLHLRFPTKQYKRQNENRKTDEWVCKTSEFIWHRIHDVVVSLFNFHSTWLSIRFVIRNSKRNPHVFIHTKNLWHQTISGVIKSSASHPIDLG